MSSCFLAPGEGGGAVKTYTAMTIATAAKTDAAATANVPTAVTVAALAPKSATAPQATYPWKIRMLATLCMIVFGCQESGE